MPLRCDARVLVTGATGHLGRRVVRRLMQAGLQVRVLSRRRPNIRNAFGATFTAETEIGDLTEPVTVELALSRCDALVAVSHIRHARALIEGCWKTGVRRAVFLSSARAHSQIADVTVDEVRAGEAEVAAGGLDAVILRPTMIFGDEQDGNLTRLMRAIQRWPVLPLPGGGRNLVQPVFVTDVAGAVHAALTRDGALGHTYDLGGPQPMTYREMLMSMAAAMGRTIRIVPVPIEPLLPLVWLFQKIAAHPTLTTAQLRRMKEDRTVDITAARSDLDFDPMPFAAAFERKLSGRI